LGGEGLQHQDGTSHLVAATVPNCKAYDPATAGELAVIVDRGMREMLEEQRDVFYYVTAMNENVAQPSLPAEAHEGVLRGLYRFRQSARADGPRVQLLGSGAMLGEVLKAADILERELGIAADVWSVTSFSELARDGVAAETAWRHGESDTVEPFLTAQLAPTEGPIVDRDRLRARGAGADPRVPAAGAPCRHARHRRLRPQRHARARCAATSRSTPRRSSRRVALQADCRDPGRRAVVDRTARPHAGLCLSTDAGCRALLDFRRRGRSGASLDSVHAAPASRGGAVAATRTHDLLLRSSTVRIGPQRGDRPAGERALALMLLLASGMSRGRVHSMRRHATACVPTASRRCSSKCGTRLVTGAERARGGRGGSPLTPASPRLFRGSAAANERPGQRLAEEARRLRRSVFDVECVSGWSGNDAIRIGGNDCRPTRSARRPGARAARPRAACWRRGDRADDAARRGLLDARRRQQPERADGRIPRRRAHAAGRQRGRDAAARPASLRASHRGAAAGALPDGGRSRRGKPHAQALYFPGLRSTAHVSINGHVVQDELRHLDRPAPRSIDAIRLIRIPDEFCAPAATRSS
jgi:hypothetical protein